MIKRTISGMIGTGSLAHAGAPCLYAERAARTGSAICSLLFSGGMYGTGECVAEKRLSGTADPHGRDRNAAPAGGHFRRAHLISKEISAFYPQILNTNRKICRWYTRKLFFSLFSAFFLTTPAECGILYKLPNENVRRSTILGCSQAVRQWTLTPSFRGFKSFHPNQFRQGAL